jgi:hypothetical protein
LENCTPSASSNSYCPLPRPAQEPVRPTPSGRGPQPARHRPPTPASQASRLNRIPVRLSGPMPRCPCRGASAHPVVENSAPEHRSSPQGGEVNPTTLAIALIGAAASAAPQVWRWLLDRASGNERIVKFLLRLRIDMGNLSAPARYEETFEDRIRQLANALQASAETPARDRAPKNLS